MIFLLRENLLEFDFDSGLSGDKRTNKRFFVQSNGLTFSLFWVLSPPCKCPEQPSREKDVLSEGSSVWSRA